MNAMIKNVLLICLLSALTQVVSAGDKKYPVIAISPELLKNANAVIREYNVEFSINSLYSTVEKRKYVVTILNQKADHHNLVYVHYDKDQKINYIKGNLYDSRGNLQDKLKKSAIEDQSAINDFSLYEDNRIKYAKLKSSQYPYTVEFEYEVERKYTLFYPVFAPIYDHNISLEKASFAIIAPEDYKVRYKSQKIDNEVVITKIGDKKTYQWQVDKTSPIKTEAYGPSFSDLMPMIYTAPSDFAMAGYQGKMDTWKDFGLWFKKLNQGRSDLPEETKQKIKEITENIVSKEEKIKAIYQYLQANTRYVSIQLGIGGFQPFEASFVDEKKYGDCKALTFYTKSMLDVVGIKSHYTLVRAGKNAPNIPSDFPVNRFNHVILCVPNNNDTIWLECTSQRSPFGFLGDFTDDRNVLLITEEGGKLTRTPEYSSNDNLKKTSADIVIDESGNAEVNLNISYSGLQFDKQNINIWKEKSIEDQKKWLYRDLDVSGARINDFKLSYEGDKIPVGTKKIDLSISKCSTVNGKRLFLKPNIFSLSNLKAKKIENRKSEFVLSKDIVEHDSITFQLPKGFYVEFNPEFEKIENQFGEYHIKMQVDGDKLIYTRTFKLNKGIYPAEQYKEFFEFTKKISKGDNAKMVFVNKT